MFLDVCLDALNVSDAEARVLGDVGLCLTFDDFQFNAEKPTIGFLVGEGFFKGEYVFFRCHNSRAFKQTVTPLLYAI